MHSRIRKQAGLSIIELMITMSLLLLLLFLMDELFRDTSAVISRGIQTTKIIATTRSASEQIKADAEEMIGPDDEGYIVIIQERRNGFMRDPKTLVETPVQGLRSDQLVFIRNAAGLRSMTPQGDDGFGSDFIGTNYAKVWYGHVLRTLPNGARAGVTANHYLGGSQSGLDRIASDYILGRQALLFNPANSAASDITVQQMVTSGVTPAPTYTFDPYFVSVVTNPISPSPTPAKVHMGLTDVCYLEYAPPLNSSYFSFRLSSPAFTIAQQNNYYYFTAAHSNADWRPRVNTHPDSTATNFAASNIAQAHPIFAPNCSEFIIDFAADLDADGEIDNVYGGNDNSYPNQIFWYDGLSPVQPNLGDASLPGGKNWQEQPSPLDATVLPLPYIADKSNNDYKVFIFRVNDDEPFTAAGTGHSYWPYLIRIRYRLHDTKGKLDSNDPNSGRDGRDNDGDGLIDSADIDEDKISGRWYEHIIHVPRP